MLESKTWFFGKAAFATWLLVRGSLRFGLHQPKKSVCLLGKLQVTVPVISTATETLLKPTKPLQQLLTQFYQSKVYFMVEKKSVEARKTPRWRLDDSFFNHTWMIHRAPFMWQTSPLYCLSALVKAVFRHVTNLVLACLKCILDVI